MMHLVLWIEVSQKESDEMSLIVSKVEEDTFVGFSYKSFIRH